MMEAAALGNVITPIDALSSARQMQSFVASRDNQPCRCTSAMQSSSQKMRRLTSRQKGPRMDGRKCVRNVSTDRSVCPWPTLIKFEFSAGQIFSDKYHLPTVFRL
jgi:hypothetical protein